MIRQEKEIYTFHPIYGFGGGEVREGGVFIFRTTNDALVRGNVVQVDGAHSDYVELSPADGLISCGVAYDTYGAGTIAKILVAGLGFFKLKAGNSCTRGQALYMSDSAGEVVAAAPGSSLAAMERLVGYSYENTGAGGTAFGQVLIARGRGEEPLVSLVDAPAIAVDARLGHKFTVTLTNDRQLANPTNPRADMQLIMFRVIQDGAGGHALTFDTKYRFSPSLASPTLTPTAGKLDYYGFVYNLAADKWDYIAQVQNF